MRIMAKLSSLYIFKLLLLCHVLGFATGNNIVGFTRQRLALPLRDCQNAKKWYKDGDLLPLRRYTNKISDLYLNHNNVLCIAHMKLIHTGSYGCGTPGSIQLEVVEMNHLPAIKHVRGKEIKSVLKTELNETVKLECTSSYYKISSSKHLPLKGRWKVVGLETYDLIESHRVKETKQGSRTLVTLTSELKFNVRKISPKASIQCAAINEKQEVKPWDTTGWKFTEIRVKPLNPFPPVQFKSNISEFNQSTLNLFPSNLTRQKPSKLSLNIILPVISAMILTIWLVIFAGFKYLWNGKNVKPVKTSLEIQSVAIPKDILYRAQMSSGYTRLSNEEV